MNAITVPIDGDDPAVRPFALMRDHVLPALDARRDELESMYAATMGRPETDPVLLAAATILQMMERRPDRAAVECCLYDVRWRLGLGLPADWTPFHPTTLVNFRKRLAACGRARLALDAGLEAMGRSRIGVVSRHRDKKLVLEWALL